MVRGGPFAFVELVPAPCPRRGERLGAVLARRADPADAARGSGDREGAHALTFERVLAQDEAPGGALLELLGFASGTRLVLHDRRRLERLLARHGETVPDALARAADLGLFAALARPDLRDHGLGALRAFADARDAPAPEAMLRALGRLQDDLEARIAADELEVLSELLFRADPATYVLVEPLAARPEERPGRAPDATPAGAVEPKRDRLSELPRAETRDPALPPLPVRPEEIDAVFAPDGRLARTLDGYAPRAAQIQLAKAVAAALSSGRALVAEAGTGVGKSLAYLVPAVLFAVRNGQAVVLATRTKNLQAQLFDKDLPQVVEALDLPLTASLVKGRADYLCLRRLATLAEAVREDGDASERIALAYLLRFAATVPDGDLERVSGWMVERFPVLQRFVEEVRCEHGPSGRRCRFGKRCFYPRLAKRAALSHLLVANHALVLSWPKAFPTPAAVVFDEGHDLIDSATEAFGIEVSDARLRFSLARLLGRKRSFGLLHALRRAERGAAGDLGDAREGVGEAVGLASRLLVELDDVAGKVEQLVLERGAEGFADEASDGRRLVRLDAGTRASERFADLAYATRDWNLHYRALAERLARAADALERAGGDPREAATELRFELRAAAEQLDAAALAIDAVLEGSDRFVCWIELRAATGLGRGSFAIRAAPIDAGAEIHLRVLEPARATVITSATLSEGGDFSFFIEQSGFARLAPERRADPIAFGSPFDYRSALRFFVPLSAGDPLARDPWIAGRAAARAVFFAAAALGGRTLGLFNARARMHRAAALLREPLARRGITLLCPGPDGGMARVLERFREEERAVLLGARAFFEGVDAPGARIRCIVIDRIPFESPADPVHEARTRRIEERGRSGFRAYSLPRALVRLRQGAGRIVRKPGDGGAIILLDPRVATHPGYGPLVQKSLPADCRAGAEAAVYAELLDHLARQGAGLEADAARAQALLHLADQELAPDAADGFFAGA